MNVFALTTEDDKVLNVNASDINHFYADNKNTSISVCGKSFTVKESISDIEMMFLQSKIKTIMSPPMLYESLRSNCAERINHRVADIFSQFKNIYNYESAVIYKNQSILLKSFGSQLAHKVKYERYNMSEQPSEVQEAVAQLQNQIDGIIADVNAQYHAKYPTDSERYIPNYHIDTEHLYVEEPIFIGFLTNDGTFLDAEKHDDGISYRNVFYHFHSRESLLCQQHCDFLKHVGCIFIYHSSLFYKNTATNDEPITDFSVLTEKQKFWIKKYTAIKID